MAEAPQPAPKEIQLVDEFKDTALRTRRPNAWAETFRTLPPDVEDPMLELIKRGAVKRGIEFSPEKLLALADEYDKLRGKTGLDPADQTIDHPALIDFFLEQKGKATEIDFGKEVEEIENQVTARSIYGKFPPIVHIKDKVLHPDPVGEYQDYGDEKAGFVTIARRLDWQLPLYSIMMALYASAGRSPHFSRELEYKHFIMSADLPNSRDSLLTYILPVQWSDFMLRPAHFASISFRMPKEASQRLINLVRKNPDVAEMFLQKAAAGFEATPETYGVSGIPRIKSDEIIIVNLDRFNPDDLRAKIIGPDDVSGEDLNSRYQRIVDAALQNKIGEIERYKYSTPYGVINNVA